MKTILMVVGLIFLASCGVQMNGIDGIDGQMMNGAKVKKVKAKVSLKFLKNAFNSVADFVTGEDRDDGRPGDSYTVPKVFECKGAWEPNGGGCKDPITGLTWYIIENRALTWYESVDYDDVDTHKWDGICDDPTNCQADEFITGDNNDVEENLGSSCYLLTNGDVPVGTWKVPTISQLALADCELGGIGDTEHGCALPREDGLGKNLDIALDTLVWSSTTYTASQDIALAYNTLSRALFIRTKTSLEGVNTVCVRE